MNQEKIGNKPFLNMQKEPDLKRVEKIGENIQRAIIRPSTEKNERSLKQSEKLSVYVEPEIKEALKALRKDTGISTNFLINKLLRKELGFE